MLRYLSLQISALILILKISRFDSWQVNWFVLLISLYDLLTIQWDVLFLLGRRCILWLAVRLNLYVYLVLTAGSLVILHFIKLFLIHYTALKILLADNRILDEGSSLVLDGFFLNLDFSHKHVLLLACFLIAVWN